MTDGSSPPPASSPSEQPPVSSPIKTGKSTLPASPRRRGFLQKCLGALSGFGLLSVLYPVLRYLEPPPESEGASRVEISLSELPPGASKTVIYRGRPAIVVNRGQEFLAYGAVCSHLGCIVKWSDAMQEFQCPCHGGRFSLKGEVTGGPVPRPLNPISVSVNGDKITVGA
jgi:cytochrome b6-f complex iron-sulfur subunit